MLPPTRNAPPHRPFRWQLLIDPSTCLTCRHNRGELHAVGGVIYRDAWWQLEHIHPIALPGWLVLKPLRHVENVADLTPDEASQLGVVIQRSAAALRGVTDLVKVYVALFAEIEGAAHIHFHLIPRRPDDPPELRGPLVFDRLRAAHERPDPHLDREAARLSAAVRAALLPPSLS